MNRAPILALFITASTLGGCASAPQFPNYEATDAACLSGDAANVVRFFSSAAEAHVTIREIDSQPTPGSPGNGPFCVRAGRHRVGISASAIGHQHAQNYLDVDLEAGKRYVMRGNLRGISIVLRLVFDEAGVERQAAEYELLARVAASPPPVPIFIPAKK